jgi:hypothetical protein
MMRVYLPKFEALIYLVNSSILLEEMKDVNGIPNTLN